jgi:hypothetical protein
MRLNKSIVVLFVGVLIFSYQAMAVDGGRVLKSAIFPGMGQLGDDQVAKGLVFMAGEATCLSLMFAAMSQQYSSTFDTKRDSVLYKMGTNYDTLRTLHQEWQNAYDKANSSRNSMYLYGGLSALCWGLNIVDAIFFAPRARNDESFLLREIKDHTVISFNNQQARFAYRIDL